MKNYGRINIIQIVSVLVTLLVYVFSLFLGTRFNVFTLPGNYIANIFMDYVGMGICLIVFFSGVINARDNNADKFFMTLVGCEFFTLFYDICSWLLQGYAEFSFWNQTVNFMFYLSAILLPTVFWFYQVEILHLKNEKSPFMTKIVVGIFIFSFIILVISNFTGFYFTVDYETGIYSRTKNFILSMIPSYILFLISMYYTITKKTNWQIKISFILVNLAPYIGGTIQMIFYGVSAAYLGMLFAIILMYVNIQVDLRRKLEAASTNLLLSQIKPRFIVETLSVIKNICESEPEKALPLLSKISGYIQGNISVIEEDSLITFEKEIEHVKLFAEIENRRHDLIKMEYSLKDVDFMIPVLSVQPLVENAIKHGLARREQGVVRIKSYLSGKYHIIEVEDNGIGFNTEKTEKQLKQTKNDAHIGLKNVRKRLLNLCGGTLTAYSIPYERTVVQIKIPVKK